MVSGFGATLGCKGGLVIGQTQCQARITTCVENDPAHANRLEDNLIRRNRFANQEPEAAAPSEGRTDATKRACRDEIEPPQESANTEGASRLLEPGAVDDTVCVLDVCDELNEYPFYLYMNECEGDYTDEVTGVTHPRDDVAEARAEEMAWYEKLKACEEVTGRNVYVKNRTQTNLLSMARHQQR